MNAFETWLNDELKGLKYNLKHGAFNNATTINTLEVALAKHRELCHHDECKAQQILAFEQGIVEAYAKGKAEGRLEGMKEQHAIEYKDKNEAYEYGKMEAQDKHMSQKRDWYDDGYKKGQADLIEKMKKEDAEMIDDGGVVCYKRNCQKNGFCIEYIEKLASESLEVAGDGKPLNSTPSSVKPKPEKLRLDLCKRCWQMTNHSYNEKTGELTCLKCKPKTRLNPKGGRELKSSGIYPKRR